MPSRSQIFLSVCILTKNEAHFIGDCIKSVKAVSDEILVLDSYSTDETVAIAKSEGCVVIQQPWRDFSFARNTLIEKAQGKWILFLDADEELRDAAFLKLRLRYFTRKATAGFLMERTEIFRHKDSGKVESVPIGLVRLFRNFQGVRFDYGVHETVDGSILNAGLRIGLLRRVRLHHKIFISDRTYIDAKQEKYLGMIDSHLECNADDGWMLLHKAKTQWYFDQTSEALATYKKLIALPSLPANNKATACCHAASISVRHGETEEALHFLRQSLTLVKDQALAWLVKGDLYFSSGKYKDALTCYDKLATRFPTSYDVCIFSYLYTPMSVKLFKMGCCHLALGNIGKAEFLFRSGVGLHKDSSENWLGLAHCYLARKQNANALNAVLKCLALNPEWDQAQDLQRKIGSE